MTTVTPDIRVRRCTVRVRRQDGWSWGDPASYVPDVTAAIEAALRRAVTAADLPSDADVTLPGLLRLQVAADGDVTVASLAEAVTALRDAAAAVPEPAVPEHPTFAVAVPAGEGIDAPAPEDVAQGALAIAATLTRWATTGRLSEILGHWPSAVLEAWCAAVRAAGADPAVPTSALPAPAVAAIAESVLRGRAAASDTAVQARRFLLLTAAVSATLGGVLPDRSTLAVVDRHVGAPRFDPRAPDPTEAPRETDGVAPAGIAAAARDADATRTAGPVVVPGLPFLVLVQLHRLGFFPPATAAVAAAGIVPAGNCVAAAVAGKVLGPPGHGWRRTPEQRRAVAVAAGLPEAGVDPLLAALAESAALVRAPLQASVVDLYADGRSRWDEVQRTLADGDVLLGEGSGLLPIAWCGTAAEAGEVLSELGGPPVCDSDVFAPFAAALREHRALPGRSVPALERTCGAAAGTALGSLAQELWGADADALLALERLRDLEVRVEVADGVRIGVARGQRWLDLRRIGLLDAWPVPWSPAGPWELVTW